MESTIKEIIQSPHFVGVNVSSKGISLELIKKIDLPILLALDIDKNMEDSYKEALSVSAEDISKFVERFKLDTIYFIEEEDHE